MSPKRSRKPLDDALAQQFIYGGMQGTEEELAPEDTSDVSPPEQSSSTNSENIVAQSTANEPSGATEKRAKLPLMGKFQTPPKEATIRFTVDLPQSMHRRLSLLAARTGKSKAEIVRVLLDEALEDMNA